MFKWTQVLLNSIEKKRAWVFLCLLAYAPWHDAYTLGQRGVLSKWLGFLGGTAFGNVAIAGVFNFLWIIILLICLGSALFKSYKKVKINKFELAILLFAFMRVAWIRIADLTSIQAAINGLLITFLFLSMLRPSHFESDIILLKKWGLRVLVWSLGLASVLPVLFRLKGHPLFALLFPVIRYRGWVGEGQPLAWSGMLVSVWSAWYFAQNKLKIYQFIPVFFLGAAAVYLNVLRISMLMIVLYCILIFLLSYRLKRNFLILILAALCLFSLNTGEYKKKNWIKGMWGPDTEVKTSIDNFQDLIDSYKKEGLIAIDSMIVTSGRAGTYDYLLEQSKGHRLLGQGTGSSQRLLRAYKAWAPEPNNEYLRVFFEHGLVGLSIMALSFGSLVYGIKNTWALPGLIVFMFGMLTDAPLIIPTFAYGPICLFLLLCSNYKRETKT